jgi:hypothetical protein
MIVNVTNNDTINLSSGKPRSSKAKKWRQKPMEILICTDIIEILSKFALNNHNLTVWLWFGTESDGNS